MAGRSASKEGPLTNRTFSEVSETEASDSGEESAVDGAVPPLPLRSLNSGSPGAQGFSAPKFSPKVRVPKLPQFSTSLAALAAANAAASEERPASERSAPSPSRGMRSPSRGTPSPSRGLRGTSGLESGSLVHGDTVEVMLEELPLALPVQRSTACSRGRLRVRDAVALLDKTLSENEEALKLKPSKKDKHTASIYHSCFRQIHWALHRCRQLQEATRTLENYDVDRLVDSAVSLEYALLGIDIVARHDRAFGLLKTLYSCNEEPRVEQSDSNDQSLAKWFVMHLAICSGRGFGDGKGSSGEAKKQAAGA